MTDRPPPVLLAATVVSGVLAAAPATAQTLGQGQDASIPWLRLTLALAVCLALAVGAVLIQRRRLGQPMPSLQSLLRGVAPAGSAEPRVTAVETRRLAGNVTVSVFKCDGRDYLVAASTQGQLVMVSLDPAPGEGPDAQA